jgi:hypothetical protein
VSGYPFNGQDALLQQTVSYIVTITCLTLSPPSLPPSPTHARNHTLTHTHTDRYRAQGAAGGGHLLTRLREGRLACLDGGGRGHDLQQGGAAGLLRALPSLQRRHVPR